MKRPHTRSVIKTIALSLALVMLASTLLLIPAEADELDNLGKLLDSFTAQSGYTFKLDSSSRFFIVSDTEPAADVLQTVQLSRKQFIADGYLAAGTKIVWGVESMALAGDIVIYLTSGIATEGYRLDVTSMAKVSASDVDGLLYGLNMLQKFFRAADTTSIKGFTAADAPDTKERTLSLECGRKYYSKEWICNLIKEMSWMGYNTIQLHFAEDGGFRMDFWGEDANGNHYNRGVYQPLNDFSWLCGSQIADYVYLMTGDGEYPTDPDAGKYLSTAEVIEILNTAKEYHIDVIPSFDSPGHMDYLTWKYEQNYLSNKSYFFKSSHFTNPNTNTNVFSASEIEGVINYSGFKASQTWDMARPYFKAANIKQPQAKAFVFELYTDIANFFREYAGSTDFSICADEVTFGKTASTHSSHTQKPTITSFAFGFEDFAPYVTELNALLNNKGYTVRIYNDFIGSTAFDTDTFTNELSDFPSNIEIMYWTSPFNPGVNLNWSWVTTQYTEPLHPISYFKSGKLPLYNCINTYTYFAQGYSTNANGYHPDCRCESNQVWTMGRSNEKRIYEEWYPADFSERGLYGSETGQIAEDVAGAYFLIWSDNPALSTEAQLWNGFYGCQNNHLYISLFDRMWSNITKMWNWNANSALGYSTFVTVRDDIKNRTNDATTLNSFPGFTSCSAAASLTADTTPVPITSQADLLTAIGEKVEQGIYTDESYNTYSAAYDEAYAIATANTLEAEDQYEIPQLISNVKTTKAALTIKTFTITINHYLEDTQTPVKDTEIHSTTTETNHYSIHVPSMNRYGITSIEGTTGYAQDASGVTFTGDASGNLEIMIFYKVIIDTSALDDLIATGNSLNSIYYTADSWKAYEDALNTAKKVSASSNSSQTDVDNAATALENAYNNLVLDTSQDPLKTPLTVEVLNDAVPKGKQVGLRIITDASVNSVTITCGGAVVKPVYSSSQTQTLIDGDAVTVWLVFLKADTAGSFTYTINGTVSVDVTVVEPASN